MEKAIEFANTFQPSSLIAIQIEGSEQTYLVPKGILLRASEYFEAALQGNFLETEQRKLRLPGCDTPTLQLFLYWICNDDLPNFCDPVFTLTEGNVHDQSTEARELATETQVILVKLWAFAEAYLIPKLQNEAMECLLNVLQNRYISTEAVACAFESTTSDVLRGMVVKEAAQWQRRGLYSEEEMQALGMIDGFLKAILEAKEECLRTYCPHMQDEYGCSPSFADMWEPYMVDIKSVKRKMCS